MSDALKTSIRIEIVNAFTAPLRALRDNLDGVKGKVGEVARAFDAFKVAANLNQAAEGLDRFGKGILTVLKPAANEFIDFEAAMSKVAALTGEVATDGFETLKSQAISLGAATKYSAKEAADAQAIFGQQGLKTNEILAATPQALNLAAAGMLEIADAASIMGVAMSGMGIKAEETGRVVDVLAMAANAANTDVQGLGMAMKYVGPIAAAANTSLELTTAAIGKLADAGIDASSAGTGLRAVFQRLLSPSKEGQKAMQLYGLSLAQIGELQKQVASGQLDRALQTFAKLGEKLPDAKRLGLLSDIFGQEASTSAQVLISSSVDSSGKGLTALVEQLKRADGSAARTAGILQNNLKGELEKTGGAVSELSIKLGERLKPSIMQVATGVQSIVGSLASWAEKNPELANTIVRVAAVAAGGALALKAVLLTGSAAFSAIGLVGGAFKGLFGAASMAVTAVKWSIAAFQGMQAAIAAAGGVLPAIKALTAAAAGPVGLVVAAAAAGYAIGTLIDHIFGLSDALADAFGWVTGQKKTERQANQGMDDSGIFVYADGTQRNERTGEVIKVGDGPAHNRPKFIRDAMAKGLMTPEAINNARKQASSDSAQFAAQQAAGRGLMDGAQGGFNAVTGIDENTKVAERGHKSVERAVNRLTDEIRRGRRPPPMLSPTPLGDF